jgi:outer membrane protein assembly factor BamB
VRKPRSWTAVGAAVCLLVACSSGSEQSSGSSTSRSSAAPSTTSSAGTGSTATTVEPGSGAQWTTYYRDAARDGLERDGPSSPNAIRNVWTSPTLDGDVYAQPLLTGSRVVIATENDTIYSLDASDGKVEWKTHLGEPVSGSSLPCGNVDPVGITGTPVVDANANRIYAVGMIQPSQHMLFELDLSTGQLLSSARVDADGADPEVHNQRAALVLSNGTLFIPYGGRFGDCGDYHGRVVGVSVSGSTLGPITSYTLPTQREGGFWAPPGAAVAADGSLYLASGNSSSSGTYDYGNSVIRLSADLKLLDSFAPRDWASLNAGDTDLGSTSPVLLPGSRVFQIGKSGIGYLLDAQHLGGIAGQLHSGNVCDSRVFGGIAHDGDTMFVPCSNGVVQVTVNGDNFTVGWTAAVSTPGPTIIAGAAVWTVATDTGDLIALDPSSGTTIASEHIGSVPSRFTSPAAGAGRVVVGARRMVLAFGT